MNRRGTVVAVHDDTVEVGIGPEVCLACPMSACRPTTVRAACSTPCQPGDIVDITVDAKAALRGALRLFVYPAGAAVLLSRVHWGAALAGAGLALLLAIVRGRRGDALPRVVNVFSGVPQRSC